MAGKGGYGAAQRPPDARADSAGQPSSTAEAGSKGWQTERSDLESERELRQYLEKCYLSDLPLSCEEVARIIGPPRTLDWQLDDVANEPSMLHLAVMCEASEPDVMAAVVTDLLARGANPELRDSDGDTVVETVLALSREEEEEADEDSEPRTRTHMAALLSLLQGPRTAVGMTQGASIVSFVRRKQMDTSISDEVYSALAARLGREEVKKLRASEELVMYLESCVYEVKKPIKASKIHRYLSKGASPGALLNGATALHLVVLNPYTPYEELLEVFRLMISADPEVAGKRDGFKLTAMDWAVDYVNVCQQHGLRTNNAGMMLAILPAIMTLVPPGVEGGEMCIKASQQSGFCTHGPGSPVTTPLRFTEGDRVCCRVSCPGNDYAWEEGVVVGLWYREDCWPKAYPGAPYEVLLDIGGRVVALADHDRVVRSEATKAAKAAAARAGATGTAGRRFQRRQREDGAWELLDTKSGRARPCSPPDSDDEE